MDREVLMTDDLGDRLGTVANVDKQRLERLNQCSPGRAVPGFNHRQVNVVAHPGCGEWVRGHLHHRDDGIPDWRSPASSE